MRFAAVSALLVFAVALSPMSAQAGITYGGFGCPPQIPCDQSDPSFPTTNQILASANACAARNIGVPPPNGSFFQDSNGIDNSGCLTTKLDALPATAGGRTLPHCCIEQTPRGGCMLSCNMVGQ